MKMMILGLEITFLIFESNSLKEKRSIVKSILDRMHHRYNVSAAEVSDMDILNKAVLGFVTVSNNNKLNEKVMQRILNEIDNHYDEVEIIHTEWIDY